jgi:hypothetical protein
MHHKRPDAIDTRKPKTLLCAIPDYTLAIAGDELDYGCSFAVRGAMSLPLAV